MFGGDWRCAFCGAAQASWLHRLDLAKNHFRKYGKGHTIGDRWALCQLCEDAYQSEDEDRAVARMMLYNSEGTIDWHMTQRAGIPFDIYHVDRGTQRGAKGWPPMSFG